jgi:uncharacterized membrane protein
MLAGLLIVTSVIAPVGLRIFTDWFWASGILLIGLAVVAVAVGLFGLYPQASDRDSRLAVTGAVFAAIAGIAALSLVAMLGLAIAAEVALGVDSAEPIAIFGIVALLMAGGFSLGFLMFGIAGWRTGIPSRTVGKLLLVGGVLLLVPVVIEVLGLVFEIGTPLWVFFPVLGLVAIDALAVGYTLRSIEKSTT